VGVGIVSPPGVVSLAPTCFTVQKKEFPAGSSNNADGGRGASLVSYSAYIGHFYLWSYNFSSYKQSVCHTFSDFFMFQPSALAGISKDILAE
jgi:hypothetical protein